jgi:hypothetical protein
MEHPKNFGWSRTNSQLNPHGNYSKTDGYSTDGRTPQAISLSNALKQRGIDNEIEYDDGIKCESIYIKMAKLYIEIDANGDSSSSGLLSSDIDKDAPPVGGSFATKIISNKDIDSSLEKVADSIALLVYRECERGIEEEKKRSLGGKILSGFRNKTKKSVKKDWKDEEEEWEEEYDLLNK